MEVRTIPQHSRDPVTNIVLDTIAQKKQALVFVNAKRSAEKTAEEIGKKIKTVKPEWSALADRILDALSAPTKQCERLAACVRKGIAFHHAGLTQKQRELIETAFRKTELPIICCTPTLAAGVDLPAFRAIVKDLRRFAAPRGMVPIPVLEYHQMAGRAGRPKYDSRGEAICIAASEAEADQIVERYFKGDPEDLLSKLAVEPVLRTYLLALIAAKFVDSRARALEFFGKTFWAHQFQDMGELARIIDKMLALLDEWEFIRVAEKTAIPTPSTGTARVKKSRSAPKQDFIDAADLAAEFTSASDLAKGTLKATLLGERVAQLYLDPLTAHELIEALRHSSGKFVTDFALFHLVSSRLEMRPFLRVKVREYDAVQQQLAERYAQLLIPEPSVYEPEYEDYLNGVKTALFFNDWADERTEEVLLEQYEIRPGEIRAKLDVADWMLYATAELATLMKFHPLLKSVLKARFRLKYGVREELLPLLKLEGIGRVRARKLFNAKIKDIGDIQQVDLGTLAQLIGKDIAAKVKKQVGQDPGKVAIPEHKRKGQISLLDYRE